MLWRHHELTLVKPSEDWWSGDKDSSPALPGCLCDFKLAFVSSSLSEILMTAGTSHCISVVKTWLNKLFFPLKMWNYAISKWYKSILLSSAFYLHSHYLDYNSLLFFFFCYHFIHWAILCWVGPKVLKIYEKTQTNLMVNPISKLFNSANVNTKCLLIKTS